MKKWAVPLFVYSILGLGLALVAVQPAVAANGSDKASNAPALTAASAKTADCPGCKDGKVCPACAAKKAAKASSCPDCKDGKMCAMCAAKMAAKASSCPDCKDGKMCAACAVKKAEGAKAAKPARFLGNAKCPIMGGKSNPKLFASYSDPKTHTYAKIHVCCAGCVGKVKKNPAAAYKKVYLSRVLKNKEGKVIAKKGQPLDLKNEKCPIMGGKVSPKVSLVYNGYKVGLCCAGCEKQFLKSPEKHLAKLLPQEKPSKPGKVAATR